MKASLFVSAAGLAMVQAQECIGLVPCVRSAQEAGDCSASDNSCFCTPQFWLIAETCLKVGQCPGDMLETLYASFTSRCDNWTGPTDPTDPDPETDTSTTAGPTTTESSTTATDVPPTTEDSTTTAETTGDVTVTDETTTATATDPSTTDGSSVESTTGPATATSTGGSSSASGTGSGSATAPGTETTSAPTQKMTTSTIYATRTFTVTDCPVEVTDCPKKPRVTTETIAISTTICPVDEVPKTKTAVPPPAAPPAGNQTVAWTTSCPACVHKTTPGAPVPTKDTDVPPVVTAGAAKAGFALSSLLFAAFVALY